MAEKYGQIPTSFKGRMGYIWDYYKWYFIGGVIVIILAASLISQVFGRTRPDYVVILGTSAVLLDHSIEPLRQHLESLGEDINGDGEVVVEIHNLFRPASADTTAMTPERMRLIDSSMNRLMSELQLGNAILFITDEDYLNWIQYEWPLDEELFQQILPDRGGYAYNWAGSQAQLDNADVLPENLFFSIRRIENTAAENRRGIAERESQAKALLERIMESANAGD